jgi:hypothetical protein
MALELEESVLHSHRNALQQYAFFLNWTLAQGAAAQAAEPEGALHCIPTLLLHPCQCLPHTCRQEGQGRGWHSSQEGLCCCSIQLACQY